VLAEAMTTYTPEQLIENVLFVMMEAMGRAWQAGQLNIATEHLITNFVRHRMLIWLHHGPPVYPNARPVVLACAPGELHEGSLIMLGVLLRRRRWPVAYLGQDVPLSDLAGLVRDVQPAAVVLVAMTPDAAAALAHWPEHLREAAETGRPAVAFGGYVFSREPAWRERVPGLWLGESVAEGVEQLEAELLRDDGRR
jgi:methanogenic corrinoid protein MtbC1